MRTFSNMILIGFEIYKYDNRVYSFISLNHVLRFLITGNLLIVALGASVLLRTIEPTLLKYHHVLFLNF